MSKITAFPKKLAWAGLGALYLTSAAAGSASANTSSIAVLNQADSHIELAQVPNADLACYLHSLDGQQYDLSALCPGFGTSEVVLQTGDVQITLRWDTSDDLDLFVRDPFGEEVSYFNPAVSSGGLLDVDANAGCAEQMAAPVENIFWPTGGGIPGDYVVTVDLFSYCGDEVPISFELTMLVKGEITTQTGTVSADQTSVSFPFTYPEGDAPAETAAIEAIDEVLPLPNAL